MKSLRTIHVAALLAATLGAMLALSRQTQGAEGYGLTFCTYLGGTGGEDTARAVAVDAEGNIFVTGGTKSADFPTTPGAYDRTYDGRGGSVASLGPMDVFVTKLDPAGRIG